MHTWTGSRGLSLRAAVLAVLGLNCFTGDAVVDQPCQDDADCNPFGDVLGERLRCTHAICGYTPRCGDGVVDAAEACDDGDRVDDDECSNACALPFCGDGQVQLGEQCDDGDRDDTDECPTTCFHATCGDGFIYIEGDEQCDDGNDDPHDGCALCSAATCGDGHTHQGVEPCDDADPDLAPGTCFGCVWSICNDGIFNQATEPCEDNNVERGDGCDACRKGATSISKGSLSDHTCVLREGRPICWGDNDHGRLGFATAANLGDEPGDIPFERPHELTGLGKTATLIATGGQHTCAITTQSVDPGSVYCWGHNNRGQCGAFFGGVDATDIRLVPVPVEVSDAPIVGLALGHSHTCALDGDGRVRCWGDNTYGQLARPPGDADELPNLVTLAAAADQVVAGKNFTCAHLETDEIYCWGDNTQNAFSDAPDAALMPAEVAELAGATRVTAGELHICGLKADGSVACRTGPDAVHSQTVCEGDCAAGPYVSVVAGGLHTCALAATSNEVQCWGGGFYGQTGNLGFDVPTRVLLDEVVLDLHVGFVHTCALLEGGVVRCWGGNGQGQAGVGRTDHVFIDPDNAVNLCAAGIFAVKDVEDCL